jgi:formylglycine-generating enzyme required for sulfatase activity
MTENIENFKPTVERFIRRFDKDGSKSYRRLTYYAALPLVLTPALLNYLHAKFLHGRVPWEAQADLLLSDLCEQVGYEMYAMEPALRDYLLNEIENSDDADNMQEVAYLLLSYVQQSWHTNSVLSHSNLHAQRWAAMAYIADRRDHAIQEMATAFKTSIYQNDQAQMTWLSRLTEAFKPQLEKSKHYPKIVEYAQQVSQMIASGGSIKKPLKVFEFEVVTVNKQGEIITRTRQQANYYTEDLGRGVTLDMVYIPGGTFLMGSPENEEGMREYESPQHQVTVSSFFMGKYPVTQAQWKAVMGKKPSRFTGKNHPVENVSYDDAVEFCQRLSKKTGKTYRLPSDAEWEYACRAGTTTPFYFGETITPKLAHYNQDWNRGQTIDVGNFPPNAFGLYDMHGNVWEWCADPWHDNYQGAPTDGSVWKEGGNSSLWALRGGAWYGRPGNVRSAFRYKNSHDDRTYGVGFRLARL